MNYKDILLFFGAIIFSVALMFAFIELPRWIDTLLHEHIGFPGFDQGASEDAAYKSEIYIDAFYLRWIGYGSLLLVGLFIVMGFVTRKSSWAWAGAFVIFLPVFGQFALSMFFLSGLGILRAGWLPMMEAGFPVLDLGMVIYIPYWIIVWIFGLFNWYAHDFICWLFMSVGAFLFVWGVFVWLQSRFGRKGVATQWIYKISRHPQYLGWIIWSYGFMLFSVTENNMKKSWGVSTSFPWLITTMIIIAICMIEELSMKEKYGKEYDDYRDKTPFLFPIPKWLKAVLKAPMKLVTRENYLQSRKQVALVSLIYTLIFIAVSLFWVDFGSGDSSELKAITNPQKVIDSIAIKIQNTNERRQLSWHFYELGKTGKLAVVPLISYLSGVDPVKREFAANQLGRIKDTSAVWPLILALDDENWRVRNSSSNALAAIGDQRAAEPIFKMIKKSPPEERSRFYRLMGSFKIDAAWPYLVEGLEDNRWYIENTALQALVDIDADKAMPYVFGALSDTNYQARRKAVFVLLELKPDEAIEPLKQVLDDEDFEVRFYARQAIELIQQNK